MGPLRADTGHNTDGPPAAENDPDVENAILFRASAAAQPTPSRNTWKTQAPKISNPCPVLAAGTKARAEGFAQVGAASMLMTKERRSTTRTLSGWAISVLQDAGAIRECEIHGWMQDRADPHARERAFAIARQHPPTGVSSEAAAVAIAEVLDGIGDTCPECPSSDSRQP
jgi:hypothetical protein